MTTRVRNGSVTDWDLRRSAYEFDLPAELIAQEPLEERDQAKLMVIERAKRTRRHALVRDLPSFLDPGDVLVLNDTRVVPARVVTSTDHGGRIEILFVRPIETGLSDYPVWSCLGRPSRAFRPGQTLMLPGGAAVTVLSRQGPGRYVVQWRDRIDVLAFLERYGQVPLPPYIRRPEGPSPRDAERYQTVFASVPGSVAAPTAGLHLTNRLLTEIEARGVHVARVTLHVGPGTFQPVRNEDVREHRMEPEWCSIPKATAEAVRAARARGNRVIAVGTTTTRALESAATEDDQIVLEGERWADRYITPGYRFRVVDRLLTNFHLPGSTLLLLVAALVGREFLLESYAEAVAMRYRFYSYGDAMLIL